MRVFFSSPHFLWLPKAIYGDRLANLKGDDAFKKGNYWKIIISLKRSFEWNTYRKVFPRRLRPFEVIW